MKKFKKTMKHEGRQEVTIEMKTRIKYQRVQEK